MKKILVPFNFDKNSELAMESALQFATSQDVTISLVHTVYFPKLTSSEQIEIFGFNQEKVLSELKKKSEARIKKIIDTKNAIGARVITKLLDGKVVTGVSNYARKWKADLMIIGETGNTLNIEDYYFGTLTDRLVHKSEVPVLVVKKKLNRPALKHIILADEFATDTKHLVQTVNHIEALFADPKIEIVRINTSMDFMSQDVFDERIAKYHEIASLKHCTFQMINFSSHGDGLVYYAGKRKADLVAIGQKHRSTLRRWIIGEDLAEHVMDHSSKPVLVF